ncbi:unnamed protein product [Discosporangium mesarthrocarpum]
MALTAKARVPAGFPFDCLAITAPNSRAAGAYLEELARRVHVEQEQSQRILLVSVADPSGVRVGSGGGTLNALLEVDDVLRTQGTVDGLGMEAARVLLVHSGGDSQRSPTQCVCGKAWSALNSCSSGSRCNTPMDLLVAHLSQLFSSEEEERLPKGSFVVTSCDVMLLVPQYASASADWSRPPLAGWAAGGVTGLAISANAAKYAPNHGVYSMESPGMDNKSGTCGVTSVIRYLQKPSLSEAKEAGAFICPKSKNQTPVDVDMAEDQADVAVDTGVVLFEGEAASTLVQLAKSPLLRGCTTRGATEGVPPLRLELYSDIMLALNTGTMQVPATEARDDRGNGEGKHGFLSSCGPCLPQDHPLTVARTLLWDSLHVFPLGALLLEGASFVHLGTTPELCEMITFKLPTFIQPYGLTPRAASAISASCMLEDNPPSVAINSRLIGAGHLAPGAIVEHSLLEGDGWDIGTGALVSGVRSIAADHNFVLRSGMCLQQTSLHPLEMSQCPQGTTQGTGAPSQGQEHVVATGKTENEGMERECGKFVLSLFSVTDRIKDHYGKASASFCGASWDSFFAFVKGCVGCSNGSSDFGPDSLWKGVPEEQRTLWHAQVFPVLESSSEAPTVLWMQDVKHQHVLQDGDAPPPPPGTDYLDADNGAGGACKGAVLSWLKAERLSFKDILARADPSTEFAWRRLLENQVEKGIEKSTSCGGARDDTRVDTDIGCEGDINPSAPPWDAVVVASRSLTECRVWTLALATLAVNGAFAGANHPKGTLTLPLNPQPL